MADFESETHVYSTSLGAYSLALICAYHLVHMASNILSLYVCLVYMKMFF